MNCLDMQGNPVRVGVAYQWAFAMPGPDVTCLVVEEDNGDGTFECYDVIFKFKVSKVKGKDLWRPLKHTWSTWTQESKAVIDYIGEQALDLN